jgi:hypothetical protein
MTRHNDQPPANDADLAAFIRLMNARFADDPPSPPAEPEVDKPSSLIGAEAELFRCEIAMRLGALNCGDVGKCRDRRCQRSKRCRQQDELRPLMDEARARVARERAKWKPAERKCAAGSRIRAGRAFRDDR